jgi:hypothetical protein
VSFQPAHSDSRASDADREAAVTLLREAATDGRIDADELEERLAAAYGARWRSELAALTWDVERPFVFRRPARPQVSALALVSLVTGLLWVFWLGSITAVITGHLALYRIARSGGAEYGRTAAILGLLFGYFGVATLLAVILFASF